MTTQHPALSQRYLTGLRAHLAEPSRITRAEASALGREVIAQGLDTLDLARLHDHALGVRGTLPDGARLRTKVRRRAGGFFRAALAPIERLHRTTRESCRHLREEKDARRRQALALAGSNRRLEREVARRRAGETALRQATQETQKLFAESQLMHKKMRLLTRQVLTAHEDERRQISRELHDEVIQTLAGISVELAALGGAGSLNPRQLQQRIARTQRHVEKSIGAVHQFARELRPAVLDHLGLIAALQLFLERLSARKKLVISLTAFAGVDALDHTKRTVLYRVAQEALTNVGRHARARTVDVTISEIPGAVRMEVKDDGKSFHVQRALSSRAPRRLGLLGMRERVEMVGGALTIESARPQGTTVRVEIPSTKGGTQ